MHNRILCHRNSDYNLTNAEYNFMCKKNIFLFPWKCLLCFFYGSLFQTINKYASFAKCAKRLFFFTELNPFKCTTKKSRKSIKRNLFWISVRSINFFFPFRFLSTSCASDELFRLTCPSAKSPPRSRISSFLISRNLEVSQKHFACYSMFRIARFVYEPLVLPRLVYQSGTIGETSGDLSFTCPPSRETVTTDWMYGVLRPLIFLHRDKKKIHGSTR